MHPGRRRRQVVGRCAACAAAQADEESAAGEAGCRCGSPRFLAELRAQLLLDVRTELRGELRGELRAALRAELRAEVRAAEASIRQAADEEQARGPRV